MTYVVSDGPPEDDATHLWTPAAGDGPPLLNDQGAGALDAEAWVRLRKIDGWRDLPEIVDRRSPRTYGVGEVPYPSQTLGRTFVYVLQARGSTPQETNGLVTDCLRGFGLSVSDEGTMTVTAYSYGVEDPTDPVWTFSARVIDLKREDVAYCRGCLNPWRRGFTVTLRLSDPLFYTVVDGDPVGIL